MQKLALAAALGLLLALPACGRSPGMRAATGGVAGAVGGTLVAGPAGTVPGAVAGGTYGAATAN